MTENNVNNEELKTETAEAEEVQVEVMTDDLQAMYDKLLAEKQVVDDQMLRLQADFDNFRKRTRAEKETWRGMIIGDMAASLLPVLDNFSHAMRAMEMDEAAKNHYAGVAMILRQLQETLKTYNVEEIAAADGVEFDPAWHNAVGFTETEDAELDGKISEVLMSGYKVGEKLIRPTTVKVYKV